LYFSAQLGIPILVCPDTYMAKIVQKYKTGFVVDIRNPLDKNAVYEQYCQINWNEFFDHCDLFMNEIIEDEKIFCEMVRKFTTEV